MRKFEEQKNHANGEIAKAHRPQEDVAAKVAKYQPLCDKGDINACVKLAKVYLFEASPPDIDAALVVLREAILVYDPSLAYRLGILDPYGYDEPRGVRLSDRLPRVSPCAPMSIDGVARTNPDLRTAIRFYTQAKKMQKHK